MAKVRPTWIEIDLSAIRHNVRKLRQLADTNLCAVVKADGYGHGAVEVAGAALDAGAACLAVALVEEGRLLRSAGIEEPILLLTEPPSSAAREVLNARLTPFVYTPSFAQALADARPSSRREVSVHVHFDTGMGRVGIPETTWESSLQAIIKVPGISIDGVSSHLAKAEEVREPTTQEQLVAFNRVQALAMSNGLIQPIRHLANTAATIAWPATRLDLVRCGIGIYGLSPGPQIDAIDHGLRPALQLNTAISYVKLVPQGTPVSYGQKWRSPRRGWLATLPIGYADGLPRRLGGHIFCSSRSGIHPVVGSITMDQTMVWFDDSEPQRGEQVVLMGGTDQHLRVDEWARKAGTISYEVVTQLTRRLPRRTIDG